MQTAKRTRRRAFIHNDCETGIYHVVSRVVDRRLVLGVEEKRRFVGMMHALAALCQIQVLTYCVMGNHFHILLRVPDRPEGFDLDLDTLRGLWRKAVGHQRREQVDHFLDLWQTNGSERAVEEWRQRTMDRMFKLSEFMRLLKNRFSHWFNKRHDRTGTLWEARYTSVAVEDEARALRTMATYIDLNPVRAGLVSNPADYPWCGYAEAMAGNTSARDGLERIVWHGCSAEDKQGAPREVRRMSRNRQRIEALVIYRSFMGHLGRELHFPDGTRRRRGLSDALAARFQKEGAGAVQTETLLHRVRHLTRGVLFGSRDFIDNWFTENRARICTGTSAESRRTGARPIGRKLLPGLQTLRTLKTPSSPAGPETSPALAPATPPPAGSPLRAR